MKLLFVWTGVTGYMADCWRELASRADVELKVVVVVEARNARQVGYAANEVLQGLDAVVVQDEATAPDLGEWTPDVMFVVGWRSRICREFVRTRKRRAVPKVCCFDMPWRWKPRCLVAPLALGRFLRGYSAAFVPGNACARYAKWLGFRRIYRGLFAIDVGRFASGGAAGDDGCFLYVGRNAPEKRLDVLREGYRLYRERGGRRELKLYGKDLPGGFVSPGEVPRLMHSAAAFVLASDFDPWPLVLLEAMSAGCPIVASDRCTNRPELGANWIVFRHGDAEGLARALLERDSLTEPRRAEMRRENRRIARAYDCSNWADKVIALSREILLEGR